MLEVVPGVAVSLQSEPPRSAVPATILAFDFGERFIGIAVGDSLTRLAHVLTVLAANNDSERFERLAPIIDEWRPQLLVVGHPLSMDGTPHALTARAERFSRQLGGRFRTPVKLVDERLTSVEAARELRSTGRGAREYKHDAHSIAARVILESYFHDYAP
jgi:putative holliday junction resolvase